jgi:hypothetical protein
MSDIPLNSAMGPETGAISIPPVVGPELTLAAPVDEAAQQAGTSAQNRLEVRVWCAFVFLICAAMYGLALYLTPTEGLHEKFGMPKCGMLETTGIPCPTCGCTTAVTFFAHGHPISSFLTQPFGFAVALVGLILLPLTFWGMVTGRWKGPSMWFLSWHWQYWTYGGAALLLLAWVYHIIAVKNHWTF